jgi:hypothetical protein
MGRYFMADFGQQPVSEKVVLICDRKQVEELILGLENIDPHL